MAVNFWCKLMHVIGVVPCRLHFVCAISTAAEEMEGNIPNPDRQKLSKFKLMALLIRQFGSISFESPKCSNFYFLPSPFQFAISHSAETKKSMQFIRYY
jgi:hypothetical protein